MHTILRLASLQRHTPSRVLTLGDSHAHAWQAAYMALSSLCLDHLADRFAAVSSFDRGCSPRSSKKKARPESRNSSKDTSELQAKTASRHTEKELRTVQIREEELPEQDRLVRSCARDLLPVARRIVPCHIRTRSSSLTLLTQQSLCAQASRPCHGDRRQHG
ncbi:hypothetical protein BCV70DRAFT_63931 [Testicularia cyperi]|uniref:Uncharacterized protein n=1 Tax=Testicularia cyperi TaxID=1882483 RepID=A0A317XVX9_9BASI|nr:hypothetical protein BCV70DRAFT_63931 [Testicularia cyperi]